MTLDGKDILEWVWGYLNPKQREELLKILTDLESEEQENDA